MALAASGLLSVPLDAAERLVASSSTFQTVTGAGSEAAALAFVHRAEGLDELSADGESIINARPRAIVYYGDQMERTKIGVGDWTGEGTLLLAFQFATSSTYEVTEDDNPTEEKAKEDDAIFEFTNNIGAIVSEMEANSGGSDGTNGYLNAVGFSVQGGPWHPDEDDEDKFFSILYSVRFVG